MPALTGNGEQILLVGHVHDISAAAVPLSSRSGFDTNLRHIEARQRQAEAGRYGMAMRSRRYFSPADISLR